MHCFAMDIYPDDATRMWSLGSHAVACRDNALLLLLLWCSGKEIYSSDFFLPPQKLHVLRVAGMAKARGAVMAPQ